MLAKTYTGNIWKKTSCMLGQWKINGLRCFITAYKGDTIFNPVRLKFQSREGIVWNTLTTLEDYLFDSLPANIIQSMLDYGWALDGEIYLPGYNVNEINHFVKDPNDIHNKLLQFWCYDIAIPEMVQHKRDRIRLDIKPFSVFDSKDKHLNNKKQLVILPTYHICNDADAHAWRDKFIDLGFEGLILRNPDADYQYGRRRVGYMENLKLRLTVNLKLLIFSLNVNVIFLLLLVVMILTILLLKLVLVCLTTSKNIFLIIKKIILVSLCLFLMVNEVVSRKFLFTLKKLV